jgi:hypothetical protein
MNNDLATMTFAEKLAYFSADNIHLDIRPTAENIASLCYLLDNAINPDYVDRSYAGVQNLRILIKEALAEYAPNQKAFAY